VQKIDVSLEEMYNGGDFSIEVDRQCLCEGCNGVGGSDPSAVRECGTCDGEGVQMVMQQLGPGMYTQARRKCADCEGEGTLFDKKKMCKKCKGKKIGRKACQHKVDLDKGTPSGHKITLHGKGHQVPEADVEDGDLIIVVE
jgi:DnaJ-class molecular chaperone